MTNLVKKLDSNITGLRFAEEESIGVLPVAADQVWYPLEPNSYADFGANTKTVARMPINPSRQLRKGVLTDLDPAAGFNNDLTQDGLTRLLQGFFVANLREDFDSQAYNTVNGDTAIPAVVGASHKYEVDAIDASIAVSDLMFARAFSKNANNGLNVVSSRSIVAATNDLTGVTVNFAAGDTVLIGGKTYTYASPIGTTEGNVLIGATIHDSLANLASALNLSAGNGTTYVAAEENPDVSGSATLLVLTVTARHKGYAANAVATTVGGGNTGDATWATATLTGGVADIVAVATTLVDETPTAAARLERVGHQGASGDLTITNDGVDLPFMTTSALDFRTFPLVPGQWIWIGGDSAGTEFATVADNGWARIRSISQFVLTFDKTSSEMVTDNGSGKTVQLFWGKVLKNEADPAIQVRRTYAMERSLGNPDMDAPTAPQAEYVMGAVPNEVTYNMTTAEKVMLDMTFLGTDYTTISTGGTILSKVGGASAPDIVSEDAFNTTSHVVRAKMSVLSETDAAPTSLFAEITELKFSVKNNDKANKAIGKLGPFEITFGFFEGSGTVQAYFNQTAAVQAVRTNADVSIDFAMAQNNQGVLFDLPLLTLNTKGLDVKINEPIMLPINMTMGADRHFNHTMLMEFFDYLPDVAMPV